MNRTRSAELNAFLWNQRSRGGTEGTDRTRGRRETAFATMDMNPGSIQWAVQHVALWQQPENVHTHRCNETWQLPSRSRHSPKIVRHTVAVGKRLTLRPKCVLEPPHVHAVHAFLARQTMPVRSEDSDLESVVGVQPRCQVGNEARRMVALESRIRRRDKADAKTAAISPMAHFKIGLRPRSRRHYPASSDEK